MRTFLPLAALVLGLAAFPAVAQQTDITVHGAYAFATAEGQANGAAFLHVENKGAQADKIVSASADVSERVELHTHLMEGDVMQMREVDSFDVPASGALELKPAGDHIMFMGLKAPLEEGSEFPLTLTFEKAGSVPVTVKVVKPGAAPAGHEKGHGHDHGHAH